MSKKLIIIYLTMFALAVGLKAQEPADTLRPVVEIEFRDTDRKSVV